MQRATFRYPEDPDIKAVMMFGQEFVQYYRNGGPGTISVETEAGPVGHPFVFNEIICDVCNAEIGRLDPCMLIGSYLYCWDCTKKDKLQYIVPGTIELHVLREKERAS